MGATVITVPESPHAANQSHRKVQNGSEWHGRADTRRVRPCSYGAGDGMMLTAESSLSQNRQRTQTHTTFHHNGDRICQKTFLFLHAIRYWRFKALKASYLSNSLCCWRHRNKARSMKTGLSLKEIEEVVQFNMNYAGNCMHTIQQWSSLHVHVWTCT